MGTNISEVDVSTSVMDSIRRIVRALRVSSRSSEDSLGLTAAQHFVLQSLRGRDATSVNELAALTFTHQSTVSGVVDGLVRRGLMERQPSQRDGRSRQLRLTRKGAALIEKSRQPPAQHQLLHGLRSLSEEDRVRFATLLEAMVTGAGWASAQPTLFFSPEPSAKESIRKKES